MFYIYLRGLVSIILWCMNGNAYYHHTNRIPSKEENYILVSPHQAWWDPIYLAFATKPKQFIFMAKKELFDNRLFGWWIRMCGAFPVDRDKPSAKSIRYPVYMLKNSNRSLVMFPSGSRYSTDVKAGVAIIAKMSGVRIIPAVYVGPNSLKGLISRHRIDINFGNPIDISDITTINNRGIEKIKKRVQQSFDSLFQEVKPLRRNMGKSRSLWYILLRVPTVFLIVLIIFLTIVFSFIMSFIWDPDKHRT